MLPPSGIANRLGAGRDRHRAQRIRTERSRAAAVSRVVELRRGPGRLQPALQLLGERVDRHPLLGERVAVADRHRVVVQRLVVDRHRPRRADLVLAAIAAADRARHVHLGLHPPAQVLVDPLGELRLAVLAHQRQHRHLDRGQLRMQAAARCAPRRRSRPRRRRRRGTPAASGRRRRRARSRAARSDRPSGVDVLELLAGVLGVAREVEVAAVGDPLELLPADREQVLDVRSAARVVAELIGVVRAQAQMVGADPEVQVPVVALLEPMREPRLAPRPAARRTPSPSARTHACGR